MKFRIKCDFLSDVRWRPFISIAITASTYSTLIIHLYYSALSSTFQTDRRSIDEFQESHLTSVIDFHMSTISPPPNLRTPPAFPHNNEL